MGTPGLEKPTLAVDGSLVGRAMATFYPPESRRNHEEGDTAVEMCVDANGRTDSVSVISSSGFDRLDVVTVQMLNSMPLKPARLGGKPVPMCGYVFMVVWSLRKPPSPDDPQPDETQ
jgi:TonB family protein